jgi:hypothetical protein
MNIPYFRPVIHTGEVRTRFKWWLTVIRLAKNHWYVQKIGSINSQLNHCEENAMKNQFITLVCLLLSAFFALNTAFADDYAQDRAAIMDLQGRYIFALDFKDAETYASTFTEDGIINWARGDIKGRKAIYEFIASGVYNPSSGAEEGKWPAASRHFVTNQVIKVEGNTAKAFAYWFQATNNTADRRTMVLGLFGHYEDELVKINGQWYFKNRTIYNEGLEGRHKAGEENPAR